MVGRLILCFEIQSPPDGPVTSRTMKQSLTELPDDYSNREPPDPIPNSEVKPVSADGSVGFPHVRVGHRQASIFSRGNTSEE